MTRTFKLFILAAFLAASALLYWLLTFSWYLNGDNVDLPPTWFCVLTFLFTIADIALFIFLGVRTLGVLGNKTQSGRTLKGAAILLVFLSLAQLSSFYVYPLLPQWDFQDSLFDDLYWPGPSKISAICNQTTTAQSLTLKEAEEISHIDDFRIRYSKLEGKTITGWKAWIKDTTRHEHYSNPDHRPIDVYLEDPYTQHPEALPESDIYYFTPADADRLSVGQEILICGNPGDASIHNDIMVVDIGRATINPLPLPEEIASTQIPGDFRLEYTDNGCQPYLCPEYKLTIEADGAVTYEGYNGMASEIGVKHTTANSDKIKQLVFELGRSELFTAKPAQNQQQDQSIISITVTMNGSTSTIATSWRSAVSNYYRLIMLMGKIKEVAQVQNWTR